MPRTERLLISVQTAVDRKIFIVDDHPTMRRILTRLVQGAEGMVLVGVAETAEEVIASGRLGEADLMLVDLALPGMSGIELIKMLHSSNPSLPSLVFSGHTGSYYREAVREAGGRGFVGKDDPERLLSAMWQVLNGELSFGLESPI